jgi:segregation and condensation protein B
MEDQERQADAAVSTESEAAAAQPYSVSEPTAQAGAEAPAGQAGAPEPDAVESAPAAEAAEPEAGMPQEPETEPPSAPEPDATEAAPPAEAAEPEAAPLETEAEPEAEPVEAVAEPPLLAAEPIVDDQLKAILEAIVYVADEPVTAGQIATATGQPQERIQRLLSELAGAFSAPEHGVMVREVAGGWKMATKPEHHDAVRAFVKSLKPPLKLSLAALETLAAIAYKQPITGPEIMEIRGVQGAGVLKTLLDRKLIQAAGRKNVIGRPILYKTSKEFLVQFGLKDLSELPTLKEFEELRRLAINGDDEAPAAPEAPAPAENA